MYYSVFSAQRRASIDYSLEILNIFYIYFFKFHQTINFNWFFPQWKDNRVKQIMTYDIHEEGHARSKHVFITGTGE
jgi:hypothetical protein